MIADNTDRIWDLIATAFWYGYFTVFIIFMIQYILRGGRGEKHKQNDL